MPPSWLLMVRDVVIQGIVKIYNTVLIQLCKLYKKWLIFFMLLRVKQGNDKIN